jgi:putative membrane protein
LNETKVEIKKKIKSILLDWRFQVIIVSIFFTVGIISHFSEFSYPLMIVLTPYVILISGIWAIHKCYNKKYVILWILIAYVITFTLEVLGVAYSLVFGPYYYGNVLGPMLFDVPVIIGLNWVIIIFSLVLFSEWLVEKLIKSPIKKIPKALLSSFIVGLLATFFDYIMEPAAVGLNYWTWTLTSDPFNVPIQNYIAWFTISFIFAITYLLIPEKERIKLEESPHSPWFVVIQLVFFIAMRILVFFS